MPTITASTSTFTPDDITLPSTFSARNAVLFQNANGTRTNPASAVSLNTIRVTNSCTASTKKLRTTTPQAMKSTDRKSVAKGKSVEGRVDIGGRVSIKNKN